MRDASDQAPPVVTGLKRTHKGEVQAIKCVAEGQCGFNGAQSSSDRRIGIRCPQLKCKRRVPRSVLSRGGNCAGHQCYREAPGKRGEFHLVCFYAVKKLRQSPAGQDAPSHQVRRQCNCCNASHAKRQLQSLITSPRECETPPETPAELEKPLD